MTALRLVGFKSFAERTTVEFGPGISAVVGPNGSGKSNLADALRWTLGEQGRTLRTRRSEDVIFAGSSSRRAIGMADVTLVIDNHDRLLPVDYGEVEIGRRLYRSGENEYLLNRQRVRLKDLVELLDAGNIADNAFLFIGQGMVDQALALRPEERRPLFEEAAGVRRHERRRRQAEAELTEAETNLERLRDLLAELRPQARRLGGQAAQLQARRTAGVELAEALLGAARARWVSSSKVAVQEQRQVDRARAAADTALTELKVAEELAAGLSAQMAERADTERIRREALDRQRADVVELRVAGARLDSETAAAARDRQRLDAERAGAEERTTRANAALSAPRPNLDAPPTAELELVTRQLAELEAATNSSAVQGGKVAFADRAQKESAARRAELEQHARKQQALAGALAEASARVERLTAQLGTAEGERDSAVLALAAVTETEQRAQSEVDVARAAFDRAIAERGAALQQLADDEAEASAARVRLASLDATLVAGADEGLARAARARGGQLLAEGLEVDPRLRRAVSAALGPATGAYLVDEAALAALASRHGLLALRPGESRRRTSAGGGTPAVVDGAARLGGGRLGDAIRRDPQGQVTRLLERVVWLPDLAAALKLRPDLGPGWRAVTLAGEVVSDEGVVQLASEESALELRNQRDELMRTVADLDERLTGSSAARDQAVNAVTRATTSLREAQHAVDLARAERRRAEEAERVAQRRAEQLLREVSWEGSQADRLRADSAAAESLAVRLSGDLARIEQDLAGPARPDQAEARRRTRLAELRARHDELRRAQAEEQARARTADEERRRAEIALALDEARRRELDAEEGRLAAHEAELAGRRAQLAAGMASAEVRQAAAAAALQEVLAAGADDRARLMSAERTAIDSRERLRVAESTSRSAEVRAMEARLQLEQLREQLLVELASIGADGLATLAQAADDEAVAAPDEGIAADALEELLGRVIERWLAERGAEQPPSAGRLASLRRRFHELGAGNPFAVEEYAELRVRLETLETQRADMESAIGSTRELISSLSTMINDQFRTTFAALEGAFARRFHELFGGGEAQLSLTAPDDLSATGIEIHARPPGKKRQPLAMLSGGERALTAVSLLLAMLEVRPVPFCVLDEVDAALDEANVARFAKALRGLAEQTQFIVITHNRGTDRERRCVVRRDHR